MKPGWQIKTLENICDISLGKTPERGNLDYWDKTRNGQNVWLSIADMNHQQNGCVFDSSEYISDKAVIDTGMHKVVAGTLLVSFKLTLGRCAVAGVDLFTNEAIAALRIKPAFKDKITNDFLRHYFSFFDWNDFATRDEKVKGKTLNKTKLKGLPVILPPLAEQKRIVGVLDAAFEKIDAVKRNAERNLANAKELFQRTLDEEMTPKEGWRMVTFKDLFDVRDGTHDSPQYHAQGHPLITSKNLKSGTLDYNNVKLISDEDFSKINERSKVSKGDLLFAMIGTIGNPIVVEDEPNFAIKNVALFKNEKAQNMYFLKHYLNTSSVHNQMIHDAQGTNQKFVGLAYLRNFQTFYPLRSIQDTIVKKINEVSRHCDILVRSFDCQRKDSMDLKQQILSKAFNGEL